MHEMSVALEVCRIAAEQAERAHAVRVFEVGVVVGDQAGIEPDNLEFCLEALLSEPPFDGARPVIQRVPGDVLRLSHLEVDDGSPQD
jgi:Zn finger protein HypA/HybF involved in hydrogenase expression